MLPLIPWSHIFVHRFTTIHSRKILILLSKSVLIDYITPIYVLLFQAQGFLGGSDGKESTCNAGDLGSIPGFGRSPGEGNGNPLQYSCLEYWQDMDRGARGVQSMGSQRVGNNWATNTHTFPKSGNFSGNPSDHWSKVSTELRSPPWLKIINTLKLFWTCCFYCVLSPIHCNPSFSGKIPLPDISLLCF